MEFSFEHSSSKLLTKAGLGGGWFRGADFLLLSEGSTEGDLVFFRSG